MSTFRQMIIAAMLGLLPGTLYAQAEVIPQISLTAAVAEAQEAHPDAAAARARLEQAEARFGQASAGNLPSVHARLSYLQTTNPMMGFGAILGQGTFSEDVNFNDPGQLDALSGSVEANYRLYAGGGIRARQRAARAMVDAGEQDVLRVETDLAEAVVAAWYGVLQADEITASVTAGLEVLEENLRISRAREEAGELIRTERLNLEVQVAELSRELLGQQHQTRLARLRLGYLLGRDAGAMVEPDSDLSGSPPMQPPARVDLLARPELAALQATVVAAQHEVDAAAAQRMPAVDTFARYQIDKGWRRSGDGSSWTAGIAVSVPLFDGHSIRNDIAAAKAHEREASEQLRRARMALHLAYQEAKLAYELTRKQHEVAVKMVDHAQEAAQLSRQRYAAGTLLSTELIGVESRLINARVQLAVATAQQQISLAKLRRAAGLPIL